MQSLAHYSSKTSINFINTSQLKNILVTTSFLKSGSILLLSHIGSHIRNCLIFRSHNFAKGMKNGSSLFNFHTSLQPSGIHPTLTLESLNHSARVKRSSLSVRAASVRWCQKGRTCAEEMKET